MIYHGEIGETGVLDLKMVKLANLGFLMGFELEAFSQHCCCRNLLFFIQILNRFLLQHLICDPHLNYVLDAFQIFVQSPNDFPNLFPNSDLRRFL